MPTEAGYGYQGPPKPLDSPFESESTRELEDYISRRIKVGLRKTANQCFTATGSIVSAPVAIVWDIADVDTSGLWVSGSDIIVPEGAQGDYSIISTLYSYNCTGTNRLYVVKLLKEDINGSITTLDSDFTAGFDPTKLHASENFKVGEKIRIGVINGHAADQLGMNGAVDTNYQSRLKMNRLL